MNSLCLAVLIAITISKECVIAVKFTDNPIRILNYLRGEWSEDHFTDELRENPNRPRLSKRNVQGVESQCDYILSKLNQMGRLEEVQHENFERFDEEIEKGNNLVDYQFMDLPIENSNGGIRRVVRLSDRPFIKTKNIQLTPLDEPVHYPNGLLIADCSYSRFVTYVFTKTPGENSLTPVFIIETYDD